MRTWRANSRSSSTVLAKGKEKRGNVSQMLVQDALTRKGEYEWQRTDLLRVPKTLAQ
jgi:hypothetical protein